MERVCLVEGAGGHRGDEAGGQAGGTPGGAGYVPGGGVGLRVVLFDVDRRRGGGLVFLFAGGYDLVQPAAGVERGRGVDRHAREDVELLELAGILYTPELYNT